MFQKKDKNLGKKSEDNENIYKKLYASPANIAFVNFHKDEKKQFGIKDLFRKIIFFLN